MKILIPNATSPKNIGDQAQLLSLLSIIKHARPKSHVVIQSFDPETQAKQIHLPTMRLLASWLLFTDTKLVNRALRCAILCIQLVFPQLTIDKTLTNILAAYKNADAIIFVGNGYLRARKGITQSIFLLSQLVPFFVARRSGKPVIIAPMGFGPFAYRWQAALVAQLLSFPCLLFIRERISLRLARKFGLLHARLGPDHGLLLPSRKHGKNPRKSQAVVGVTLRNWYPPNVQQRLEASVASALVSFAQKTGLSIQPIVQVHAPKHGDIDLSVSRRLTRLMMGHGVRVRKPIILRSPDHAQKIYARCALLVGMRMHANILAATQTTPFVAIAYEHKTLGITQTIKMGRYCVQGDLVTTSNLTRLLYALYQNRKDIRASLDRRLTSMKIKEYAHWMRILGTI
ncbi:hypothetical protein A2Z00_00450 [Candidatus Gottesmanbacteria bacterium RBG_13_45_10]|uniref:Polysaccharide pyruvyl transferase domain-containing protein n=1 Tax=Candidatus Gottesmanbacteria bacterium RBG_13_45_10 TaxID=1798370 RepID=A0A1F5ZFW1_9BACT|nr:MAG: hypothetical protein A2Z00_00450 [Candidatus Gottesmanbacteria bacterium RBG_13_45_10]